MLDRVNVLVVEDVPVIATDLAAILTEAGATVVGPVRRSDTDLRILTQGGIDIVTLNGHGEAKQIDPLADELAARRIPFLFVTGWSRRELPTTHVQRPLVRKPFDGRRVVEAVRAALSIPG